MATLDLFTERPPSVQAAVEALATSRSEERGAVYTKPEVACFILDLSGYTPDKDLSKCRFLDPSFGHGEFICEAVDRLLRSYVAHGGYSEEAPERLKNAVRGVELHGRSVEYTRQHLLELLAQHGFPKADALTLTNDWLIHDDFLLADLDGRFTHVSTNPPYLRQEVIPDALLKEYRRRYHTIFDRADLYIPFIERGLRLLAPGGSLAFICSDRWMKNRYGRPLRKFIAEHFHLASYVDMVDTSAFEGNVIAYPAIFHIKNERGTRTLVARRPRIDSHSFRSLARVMSNPVDGESYSDERVDVAREVVAGSDPWLLDAAHEVALLRKLEGQFPMLEETGCSVGIGVATGADRIFIRSLEELDVEASRKLPILKTEDIRTGKVKWSGKCVLNPFEKDGALIRLEDYPRFEAYVRAHEAAIRKRHTAKKNPQRWYKTIDPIHPELALKPKLLIPDIKGSATVVYDKGRFYPHHNLYYVISALWDLRALQAVLRSSIAEFFVAMYSVKMRGGYLRFQAQYLRRICIPNWRHVDSLMRKRLREVAEVDRTNCDEVVFDLYSLSSEEREIISQAVYEAERALT